MKKACLTIGKALIICSLLWPVPIFFLARWSSLDWLLQMPETIFGYWKWNPVILVLGLVICVLGCLGNSVRVNDKGWKCSIWKKIGLQNEYIKDTFSLCVVCAIVVCIVGTAALFLKCAYWIIVHGAEIAPFVIVGAVISLLVLFGIVYFLDTKRK